MRWAGLAPECRQLTTSICLVNQPPFPTSGSEQHKSSFPCNVNTLPGPSASGSISSAVHFPPHAALCDPLSSRYTVAFDCLRMALLVPLMTLHCPTRRARHLQSQPIMPAHIPCPISFATSNPVYTLPVLYPNPFFLSAPILVAHQPLPSLLLYGALSSLGLHACRLHLLPYHHLHIDFPIVCPASSPTQVRPPKRRIACAEPLHRNHLFVTRHHVQRAVMYQHACSLLKH